MRNKENNLRTKRTNITKEIAILKLRKVIKELEEGYSLFDIVLDLAGIVREIKENS